MVLIEKVMWWGQDSNHPPSDYWTHALTFRVFPTCQMPNNKGNISNYLNTIITWELDLIYVADHYILNSMIRELHRKIYLVYPDIQICNYSGY